MITHIRCCDADSPLAVDIQPVFSFRLTDGEAVKMKAAVFLEKSKDLSLWESAWLDAKYFRIPCNAKLKPRTTYLYQIFVKYSDNRIEKSNLHRFETGLFGKFNKAKWIGGEAEAPVLVRSLEVKPVKKARLYFSACGIAEIYINGNKIDDSIFSPVNSDYHKRENIVLKYPLKDEFSYSHYYVCYDVTTLLKPGNNVLAIWLGNGWYNQTARTNEGNMEYGKPRIKLNLYIELADETVDELHSDESFISYDSPIRFNQYFAGEVYDGRIEILPMLLSHKTGSPVVVYPEFESVLRPQLCPPDRIIRVINPKLLFRQGEYAVFDAGENISGRVRILTSAQRDKEIVLKFAEEIDEAGNLIFDFAGKIIQTDLYISNGEVNQSYAPRFCYHGFRFFSVFGEINEALCEVIHTDIAQEGSFETSSPIINDVVKMYLRSQWSNMHMGVPTDCPHRERLGYTGDGQLTIDSACYFADLVPFYKKWIRDIADGQCKRSGHVQHTAPFGGGGGGPGGWGGAMIFAPWKLYNFTGDISILQDYYSNMCKWMDYLKSRCENDILIREEPGGWCLGDWCNPGSTVITPAYVNSCLYIMQLIIMSKIANLLDDQKNVDKYSSGAKHVRNAITRDFYNSADGKWDKGVQGSDAFAYRVGLMSNEIAAARLAAYETKKLDTGIFGTPLLLESLFELGLCDIAVNILTRTEYPSFGYMQSQGATTLWEDFTGQNSHNHPMFGTYSGILIRYLAGIMIDSDNPGFRHVIIRPCFPKAIDWVKCTVVTQYGPLLVEWERTGAGKKLNISLPVGTDATLKLSSGERKGFVDIHSTTNRINNF